MSAPAREHALTLRDLLLEDSGGWSLATVIAWMFSDGQQMEDPAQFIQQLFENALAEGAPLDRIRISLRTLHPEVRALSFAWRPGSTVHGMRIAHETEHSDAFIGSPMERAVVHGHETRCRILDGLSDDAHPLFHEMRSEGVRDYLALPLHFGARLGGALTAATHSREGFDDNDVAKLRALGRMVTPILQAASTRDIARSLLDTYVGPRTGERILSGLVRRGDGEVIQAAIWFSDLRDFTPLTESLPPADLLAMLNAYFELVAAAVTARGGEVLRFIGDAMLIVFPETDSRSLDQACESALDSAEDALAGLDTLNFRRRRAGQPEIRFGVGLHEGQVIYGNVGAPNRLDFTVMGPAVNRTARLESLTKVVDTQILVSAEFAHRLTRPCRAAGIHSMKGVAHPGEVFIPEPSGE